MPQPEIVVVDKLVKRYGPRLAVRGVSFTIREGEIVGLLGPNGSGKSTTLRILTGYLPPTAGSARIVGFDIWEHSLAIRNYVGYVPEDAPLYDGMRVIEFLRFMAEIKGLSGRAVGNAVVSVCDRLSLGRLAGMAIGKLSRGYRQRVAIAQALLNDPPILILDEPTNALDAYQVIGIRELIRSLAGRCTVVVASHVLTEIAKVATRVMILRDGNLLTDDAVTSGGGTPRYRLLARGPQPAVLATLRNVPGVAAAAVHADAAASPELATYLVEIASRPEAAEDLARAVVGNGFALLELTQEKPDLEQVFLELTRRADEAIAA
ncbi:MAG: ABC transporter ATP-binding protein [Alphaproteobacteria bacterium]|nr:ABC transporter ATP-binding protein [Alphaproteobacteria bacterium]